MYDALQRHSSIALAIETARNAGIGVDVDTPPRQLVEVLRAVLKQRSDVIVSALKSKEEAKLAPVIAGLETHIEQLEQEEEQERIDAERRSTEARLHLISATEAEPATARARIAFDNDEKTLTIQFTDGTWVAGSDTIILKFKDNAVNALAVGEALSIEFLYNSFRYDLEEAVTFDYDGLLMDEEVEVPVEYVRGQAEGTRFTRPASPLFETWVESL